jgi:hypothetical protein
MSLQPKICNMRAGPFFLCFVLMVGCAISGFRSPGNYHGGMLLGPGTYILEVEMEWERGKITPFRGIFQRRATGMMLTGLSSQGATVFRIKDPLTSGGVATVEVFGNEMGSQVERLHLFWKGLRPLFILDDKPAVSNVLVHERWPDRRPKILSSAPDFELRVDEYDWEGHAFKLALFVQGWKAKISLRQYTLE